MFSFIQERGDFCLKFSNFFSYLCFYASLLVVIHSDFVEAFGVASKTNKNRFLNTNNSNKQTKKKPTLLYNKKTYSGIIVRVNGDIITQRDLDEAVRFAELLGRSKIEESQKNEFIKEVLRDKINECLEEECLKKITKMLSKSGRKTEFVSQKEVEESFNDMAKLYRMIPSHFRHFLEKNRIRVETVFRKIRVELGWRLYIKNRYGRDINISYGEAKKLETILKEKMNQEACFVSRIFLPVFSKHEDPCVRANANNLLEMIRHGADFANLARQFSKGAEAIKGGIIGWVFAGTLSDNETNVLRNMSVGSCELVRTNRGYSILFLQDRKEAGPQTYTKVRLRQVICPLEHGRPSQEALTPILDYIASIKKDSKNCDVFINKALESGIMGVTEEVSVVLEQMPSEFRKNIENIGSGRIGNPIITDDAIVVVCVKEKEKHEIKTPTAEEIKAQKMSERLTTISERELRTLLKKASIKIDSRYVLGPAYSDREQ